MKSAALVRLRAVAVAVLAAAALAACLNLDKVTQRPPVTVHVLADPGPVERRAEPDPRTLLVLDTVADAYLDSEAIAYSRVPGTLARYQFAVWSARPGKRYADLLRRRLVDSGAFAVVAQAGGPVRGDLLLDTRLVNFHHDAQRPPGAAVVVVEAELIDLQSRQQLARTRIEARVAATSFDAAGAAAAFDQATAETLTRLTEWLAAAAK